MKKTFIQKIFFVLNLVFFVLKSVVFPLLIAVSFILHFLQLVCGMAQFYITDVRLDFLEDRGLNFIYIYI